MSISALSFSLPVWPKAAAGSAASAPFPVETAGGETFPTPSSGTEKIDVLKEDAAAEFLKWSKMNPIERMRARYLEEHNLTEEELAAKPQEEREKIEDDIKKFIERALNEKAKQKALGNITIDV